MDVTNTDLSRLEENKHLFKKIDKAHYCGHSANQVIVVQEIHKTDYILAATTASQKIFSADRVHPAVPAVQGKEQCYGRTLTLQRVVRGERI